MKLNLKKFNNKILSNKSKNRMKNYKMLKNKGHFNEKK